MSGWCAHSLMPAAHCPATPLLPSSPRLVQQRAVGLPLRVALLPLPHALPHRLAVAAGRQAVQGLGDGLSGDEEVGQGGGRHGGTAGWAGSRQETN